MRDIRREFPIIPFPAPGSSPADYIDCINEMTAAIGFYSRSRDELLKRAHEDGLNRPALRSAAHYCKGAEGAETFLQYVTEWSESQ